MAETIVAEFEIGVDTLLKNAQDAKKELNKLIDKNKELVANAKETEKANVKSSEAFVKNEVVIKRLRGEYNTYTKQLGTTVNATNKANKAESDLNHELDKTQKSVNGARESNKKLLAIRNQLNLQTTKGKAQRDDINEQIDKNNKFIKENVSELEKQKIGIGDYEGAINKALGGTKIFGVALTDVTGTFKNGISETKKYIQATNASATATNTSSKSLRAFRIALIATGIGAIVVVVGALVAAFASTQEGADAISRALAPLKGAMQGIIGVIQEIALNIENIAGGVFDQYIDNFTVLKNVTLNGVDRIRLAWNKLTGDTEEASEIQARMTERTKETADAIERTIERANGFVDAVGKAGAKISAAAEAQSQIVEKTIELEESQIRNIELNAKLSRDIKAQNKIAEDITKPLAEREAAAVKSVELAKEQLKLQQEELKNELEIALLEASKNDTSREDKKKIAEIQAKIIQAETASLELQTTQTNKVNQIRQSGIAAAKKREQEQNKAQQEAIKNKEIELKLFILLNDTETANLEERKQLTDDVLKKELEIINAKETAGLSANESEIARINARQKSLDKVAEFVEQEKQAELSLLDFKKSLVEQEVLLENKKAETLKSLRTERRLLEATTQQEQAEIQLELANQQAQARIENELVNLQTEEEAKREQKLAFEIENAETELEKDELKQEAKLEKLERDLEFEDARNLAFQELETNYQIKKDELQAKSDLTQEIATIENFKNRASIAQKGANDLLTIGKAIFGKSKEAAIASVVIGRAASIGQIIANTGIANAKAVAATPLTAGQPFVTLNTVSAGLSIGASIAGGAKAISEINSAKAARGITFKGTLQGNSHANGGIDLGNGIEAEGGENMYSDGVNTMIVNKKASSAINRFGILGALDRLNQGIGGGVPLMTPTNYAQSGGTVQRSLSNQSTNSLIDAVNDRIDRIEVVNIAEDTVRVADESFIVENEANL